MSSPSLYDLACLQRNDQYTGMIQDVTTLPREWDVIRARPVEGTWYKIVKTVGLPTGGFRYPNQGAVPGKSTYKNAIKEMLFLDMQMLVDEAIWDGDDASCGTICQLEAANTLKAAAIIIGQQFYYGTSADAKGFPGIISQLAYTVASGTGTANTTSAYLVWDDEREGVRFDVGKNGSFAISPPFRQYVTDPNNSGKGFFAYVGNLKTYIGLFVGSNLSCWGITGLPGAAEASLTNLTKMDTLAQQLYSHVPMARRNNLRWFMNRTGEAILQQNRTAVYQTTGVFGQMQAADAGGRPAYSPLPNLLNGWPIEVTDSILNTETNS